MAMDFLEGTPYMLSVEEARSRILDLFQPLESERKPILEALGQVLAEDVVSPMSIPPLANSAMDGYAVQSTGVSGATPNSPVSLRVIGQVAAGQLPNEEVVPGTAVRIMTGGPIPPGADSVVPFEETNEYDLKSKGFGLSDITEIQVNVAAAKGANVRPAGQDINNGQTVLTKGTLLRPSEVGVLASVGRDTVEVVRRPVVAVLSTGDELMEPGEPVSPGKIYDSNSYSVAAAILRYGGVPRFLGIARDNLESMNDKLEEGLQADLLLTSAGVSRGDYDIVKDLLATRGEVAFWSVRMRPAKPLAFGVFPRPGGRRVPHVGLPGNPVSALVAFEELVRPAILRMLGRTDLDKPTIRAELEEDVVNTDGRRVFARVVVTRRKRAILRLPDGRPGFRRPDLNGPCQWAGHLPGGRAPHEGGRRGGRADAGLAGGRLLVVSGAAKALIGPTGAVPGGPPYFTRRSSAASLCLLVSLEVVRSQYAEERDPLPWKQDACKQHRRQEEQDVHHKGVWERRVLVDAEEDLHSCDHRKLEGAYACGERRSGGRKEYGGKHHKHRLWVALAGCPCPGRLSSRRRQGTPTGPR